LRSSTVYFHLAFHGGSPSTPCPKLRVPERQIGVPPSPENLAYLQHFPIDWSRRPERGGRCDFVRLSPEPGL
jgi:hypothetical protein